jgi:hypothetical protein
MYWTSYGIIRSSKMSSFYRWQGTYYLDEYKNLPIVFEKVKKILEGKKYHWVEAYEYRGWRPEIHQNQEADNFSTWTSESGKSYGSFHVHDTYGVWGCAFADREKKDLERTISLYENGIEIHEKAGNGQWFWWHIIVVEEELD